MQRPGPSTAADPGADAPVRDVEAALDRLAPHGALGVAVSGGGDSMALLAIAAGWAGRHGREIAAVTVDHGLRPGSAEEAAFVSRQCARLGVAHRTLGLTGIGTGNLQAKAREARYGAMAAWAQGAAVAAVLLGHTLDDQAETLLMRLARGSGVEGLSAMEARRRWLGTTWLRPMLGVRREALRAWLSARGIAWVEDPTNEDPAFDRVTARRALSALAPLGITTEGLARTAARLSRQRRVLERAAADTSAEAVRKGAFGEVRLMLAPLRAGERDTALRVLADTLRSVAGAAYRPRFRVVEPALGRLLDREATGAMTLGGCLVIPCSDGDAVLICREPAAVAAPVPLAPDVVWDGRWRIEARCRPPAGLFVGALGPEGRAGLDRAARAGTWHPAPEWSDAPLPVRETLPAIRTDRGRGAATIVAVPPAGYEAGDAVGGEPVSFGAVAIAC